MALIFCHAMAWPVTLPVTEIFNTIPCWGFGYVYSPEVQRDRQMLMGSWRKVGSREDEMMENMWVTKDERGKGRSGRAEENNVRASLGCERAGASRVWWE